MLRHTIQTIDEQVSGQRLSEQANRRLLLDALDGVLGQVEQLLLDDIPRVPRLLEDRIRPIVEAVDRRLGYDVDQFGSKPTKMQDIIFTAQSVVMMGDQPFSPGRGRRAGRVSDFSRPPS